MNISCTWRSRLTGDFKSTEVLRRLSSWQDRRLDQGSFEGEVAIQSIEFDGEGIRDGYDWEYSEHGKDKPIRQDKQLCSS